MLETRIAKITMVACLAAFACLVTFDNLTDYDTNFEFVRHVLGIDTTFPGNALLYRRVTSAALWNAAYCLIIFWRRIDRPDAGECGDRTAAAVAIRRRPVQSRQTVCLHRCHAASWYGSSASWSSVANGFRCGNRPVGMAKRAAFRCYLTILAVLIFVHQKDEDFAIRKDEG